MPTVKQVEASLRQLALAMPESYEDFPWGDRVFKVKKKIFFFLGRADSKGLSLAVKLPSSGQAALMMPFAEPTGYNLGKAGWVTATFKTGDSPPVPMLEAWLHESYRAVAPTRIAAKLDEPAAKKAVAARSKTTVAKKKPAAKPKARGTRST